MTSRLMFVPQSLSQSLPQKSLNSCSLHGIVEQIFMSEKYDAWDKVTTEELKAYLGFCILMEITRLPALDDYWSSDHTLRYSPIADRIARDCFREISRYLHFVDNSTLQRKGSLGYDRLGKVRPVIDHLSKQFADLYEPHKEGGDDKVYWSIYICQWNPSSRA